MQIHTYIAAILCLNLAATAQELGNVSTKGSGCKPGSVAVSVTPDKKSVSLLFNDLKVVTEGLARSSDKECYLEFPWNYPRATELIA